MSRPRILLVEDEASIADTLRYALRTEGFDHSWAPTAGEALRLLAQERFELVILDIGLPDGNGFDVCRSLRAQSQIPVLFLSARQAEIDRIVGLEIGGDDYVTKPFSPREVTARIRAILRRGQAPRTGADAPPPGNTGTAGNTPPPAWQHDRERQRILRHGRALELTRNEYRLLSTLLARPGRVFTREQLLSAAWDDPGACNDRTVDAHIKQLRAKLRGIGPDEDPIETRRGLGYALREDL